MHFDHADLTSNFDLGALQRGQDYARKGKVQATYWEDGKLIGEVEGSGGERYRQTIRFMSDRGELGIRGSCSCPVSYNCKHVVAVLLTALAATPAPSSPQAIAAQSERWLQQLSSFAAAVDASSADAAGPELAWVLTPDPATGAPRLHVRHARRRKNGDLSGTLPVNDIHGLIGASSAVTPSDEEWLRLFIALRANPLVVMGAVPAGRIGARLLHGVCAAGRLYIAWTDDDMRRGRVYTVRPGPRRPASLCWRSEQELGDAVALGWRFDDAGAPDAVLPTDPPCYLEDGVLGELVLPPLLEKFPLAPLMNVLAGAPALHPEQRAGMALRLAELGLDSVVPLPQAVDTRRRSDIAPIPCLLLDSIETGWGRDEVWHDHALLFFEYDGYSTEDLDEPVLRTMQDGAVVLIERDAAAEAAAANLMAELGFLPRSADFPLQEVSEALRLPDQAAWVAFARRDIPRLRAAGWQIEMGDDYRYDLAEVDDWYAELDEEGEGGNAWFSLELGIVVGGERHALLPLLVQMVRAAPGDFAAPALAARAEEDELVVELASFERVALP
ncbi:MAG: helicase, partial [Candidatus Accumulibacter sp.]|nr:helicase [Accumulibacter sp.]